MLTTRTQSILLVLVVLAAACPVCCWGPARADEPARVDSAQLCAVKAAILWRERAWTPAECQRVADAFNDTQDPRRFFAMSINESDLRERAQRVTMLADGRIARDLGLLAVRCVTEPGSDRCANGAARGLYASQLLDPAVNVRTAEAVLQSHGGSLRAYNGGTREHGYARRIHAIEAALSGVLVPGLKGRMAKLCRQIVEAVEGERRS